MMRALASVRGALWVFVIPLELIIRVRREVCLFLIGGNNDESSIFPMERDTAPVVDIVSGSGGL